MQIIQFKAPYLLSEVTADVQSRMTIAVANILGVDVINVVLSFVPITLASGRRSQPTGVLVSAGVTEVELPAASYAANVTQDRFKKEMAAVGLNYGQLISATGSSQMEVALLSSLDKIDLFFAGPE